MSTLEPECTCTVTKHGTTFDSACFYHGTYGTMVVRGPVETSAKGAEPPMSHHLSVSRQQHLAVMLKAFDLYTDRSAVRGELWITLSNEQLLDLIHYKNERAKHAINLESEAAKAEVLDSLLDLINYAVFTVRMITGEHPEEA